MDRMSQVQTLIACFAIAAVGGTAQLVRSGKTLTVRLLVATFLYTGIAGLVAAMYVFGDSKDSMMAVVAAGLCGLGGTSVLDFLVGAISRGSVSFKLTDQEDDNGQSKP